MHTAWATRVTALCLFALSAAPIVARGDVSADAVGQFAIQVLPNLKIDPEGITTSGLSSGAFMAVQLQIAHSSMVRGAGVVAGGPFLCSQGSTVEAVHVCTCYYDPPNPFRFYCHSGDLDVLVLIRKTRDLEEAKQIDSLGNMVNHRVYLLHGINDPFVPSSTMDALREFYLNVGVPQTNISYREHLRANHTMPTEDAGTACEAHSAPYLGDCDFDAAGEILTMLYATEGKPWKDKVRKAKSERLIRFDQVPFIPLLKTVEGDISPSARRGLDTSGWVYIPDACSGGVKSCRLHVAFHGCRQGQSFEDVGSAYVRQAGYNEWAESNDIVVLYPQAVPITGLFYSANPAGCWDWWGYAEETKAGQAGRFGTKHGAQVQAIEAMINRLRGKPSDLDQAKQ